MDPKRLEKQKYGQTLSWPTVSKYWLQLLKSTPSYSHDIQDHTSPTTARHCQSGIGCRTLRALAQQGSTQGDPVRGLQLLAQQRCRKLRPHQGTRGSPDGSPAAAWTLQRHPLVIDGTGHGRLQQRLQTPGRHRHHSTTIGQRLRETQPCQTSGQGPAAVLIRAAGRCPRASRATTPRWKPSRPR